MPTYAMLVFLLPKSLNEEFNKLIRGFWWSKDGQKRGMAGAKWRTICQGKGKGGLGFRDMDCWRQIWCLLQNENSIAFIVLKTKYFPHCSLREARIGARPSLVWRSIHACIEDMNNGLMWKVGNGESIKVWTEKWLPSGPASIGPENREDINIRVCDLMDPTTMRCDEDKLQGLFGEALSNQIMEIILSRFRSPDRLVWRCINERNYTVRNGYHLMHHRKLESKCDEVGQGPSWLKQWSGWRRMWNSTTPPKTRMLVWKACHEMLPVMTNLYRRHLVEEATCPRCKTRNETTLYVFRDCPFAKEVWSKWNKQPQWFVGDEQSFVEWLKAAEHLLSQELLDEAILICWE